MRPAGGLSVLTEPAIAARRAGRPTGPRIAGLALSDSDTVLTQEQVLARLGLAGDEFAERIFARSGVRRRHLELEDETLSRTLQERTAWIEQGLLAHAIRAVDALALDPREIGTVISSSLYSLGVPSLAHRLVEHYDMDPTTDKYHLTSIGCASGVPLMRLAAQTLHEHPRKHTLVVAAESMSGLLMRGSSGDPRAKTVGSAIFGDGCAAALITRDARAEGPVILASRVHHIGESLGAVNLTLDGQDSYLHLARELPDVAGAHVRAIVERFLAEQGLEHADIDHWMVHPGGRRVIENVQSALSLSDEDLASSWASLAEHGNIGTPSIMYVLDDTLARCRPAAGDHGLMVTVGPGVTIGLMLLAW